MKQQHCCPKCGSTEILRAPSRSGMSVGYWDELIRCGGTIFSAVPVTRYICAHCGYLEAWIDNEADLQKLRQAYTEKK